ncbi:Phytosulfokine receptor 2 [Bienertia sinuspersici]
MVFQMKCKKKEEIVIDPTIWDKDREKQLFEVLCIACKCLDADPQKRPFIDQVVLGLDAIRAIEEAAKREREMREGGDEGEGREE